MNPVSVEPAPTPLHLPDEVWQRIVRHTNVYTGQNTCHEHDQELKDRFFEDRRPLQTLRLVNRALANISAEWLFRNVACGISCEADLVRLEAIGKSRLAPLVRNVYYPISGRDAVWMDLKEHSERYEGEVNRHVDTLVRFKNLQSIDFGPLEEEDQINFLRRVFNSRPSWPIHCLGIELKLGSLDFRRLVPCGPEMGNSEGSMIPNVLSQLKDLSVTMPPAYEGEVNVQDFYSSLLNRTQQIRRLSIHHTDDQNLLTLYELFVPSCLTTLELKYIFIWPDGLVRTLKHCQASLLNLSLHDVALRPDYEKRLPRWNRVFDAIRCWLTLLQSTGKDGGLSVGMLRYLNIGKDGVGFWGIHKGLSSLNRQDRDAWDALLAAYPDRIEYPADDDTNDYTDRFENPGEGFVRCYGPDNANLAKMICTRCRNYVHLKPGEDQNKEILFCDDHRDAYRKWYTL